jgi:ABC-type polysaccharide/polyol phosphate transport system ATPase subunit
MSDTVIQVENLGKMYRIRRGGQPQAGMRYTALRDVLAERMKSVARRVWLVARRQKQEAGGQRTGDRGQKSVEDFWALRDVSFEVRQGEAVGIIGRNGAGKSTLLKILSRITEPTEGRVRIKGRVASLLEVGTGFHPELTARENIFLNGAILGMSRAEVKARFDEIVAFAEVERFLDTPVKRFSSGMYVRLAFAVAAHLEPEILIVDEVLAVGDAEFQKKCLGKMQSVASRGGRTVLFVSHNLSAILTLCSTAMLLKEGRSVAMGRTKEVCDIYVGGMRDSASNRTLGVFLREIALLDSDGREIGTLPDDKPLFFRCGISVPEEKCQVSLILRDARHSPICELCEYSYVPPRTNGCKTMVIAEARGLPLLPGRYSVDFWLGNRFGQRIEHIEEAMDFDIVASRQSDNLFALQGPLRWPSTWRTAANS